RNQAIGLLEDIVGKYCDGSRTVTSHLIKLARSLFNKLCPYFISKRLIIHFWKVDTLGYSHSVMGYRWTAIAFADYDVTALWSICYLYCIVECLGTAKYALPCIIIIKNLLRHVLFLLFL